MIFSKEGKEYEEIAELRKLKPTTIFPLANSIRTAGWAIYELLDKEPRISSQSQERA